MNSLNTIRGRYTLAFGFLALILLCAVISTQLLIGYLQNNLGKYANGSYLIQNADRDLYQSRLALANLAFNRNGKMAAEANEETALSNARQAYERMKSFQELSKEIPEITNMLANFEQRYADWSTQTQTIIDLIKTGKRGKATILFIGSNDVLFSSLRDLYDLSNQMITKHAALEKATIDKNTHRFQLAITILGAITFILSASLAWFAPRNISQAIKRVTHGVHEISSGDGDLTRRINSDNKDETGDLSRELDQFVARLGRLIGEVRNGCEHIRQEMHQLDPSVAQSAELSGQQHQALEFVVTAVEEMGGANRDIAQNSLHTVNEVTTLNITADDGVKQLDKAITQLTNLSEQIKNAALVINQLTDRSDNIASVLDVILGISEQTNLLALNAAIEAARAGEQGRGFAVVADEVRNLASKTQASTEDIKTMINDLQSGVSHAVSAITKSVTMTETSVSLAQETMESINQVKQSAGHIYDFTTQTASATEQQSKVTDEINENLSNLSNMSKEVFEISQNVRSSVNETLSNTNELAGQVKRFTV
ncbi:methyl-accepting chemotaxis protein [Marinomonas transparens]|uniref:Methyl-accepting chemotaxis protein n=1 Tax=Marinomonas transparens TaxID=2795388 RepID=A0A934JRM6_9GAMM|nr:methyl-accepting chemotaxis protein [Marinomonas transparens]MBJ7536059.1 methyl-accepting chemotaxis protein [Marinomonas transparens]